MNLPLEKGKVLAGKEGIQESVSPGHSDLQLKELKVTGLFGKYKHSIPFPTSHDEQGSLASILIIHGLNGVGKTTLLQMLNGIMKLNFDVFRAVPFEVCSLSFTNGDRLIVKAERESLDISFRQTQVKLQKRKGMKGAFNPVEQPLVEEFRHQFYTAVNNISLQFFDADRARRAKFLLEVKNSSPDSLTSLPSSLLPEILRPEEAKKTIATAIQEFIREAQLDSTAFFGTHDLNLFSKIIEDLRRSDKKPINILQIRQTIEQVSDLEVQHRRLGLRVDDWDPAQLVQQLDSSAAEENTHALTVLQTYTELLQSRAQSRQLIAERLLTFEQVMADFFEDKKVTVNARFGIMIESSNGSIIDELQLSSGEHQLLYLMVSALTTRRKGTVLAIDEPELSMHISWQRKLVRNLVKCASRAAPQIILATHSPDVANEFSDNMINLKRNSKES
ncbi:ATP-binding protein [Actinokineospora sp. PR83]|uniref:ATP-binding protein n=1 Tax=Actinokineospora sp. PR83 TaxID=2884908 RepID=UPI001F26B80F|nr:ATP-binding protein [Actinokineospora sp. PR83]MCG8918777.1 ATP-binding protein [Actinokineospora sp. PR83]